MGVGETGEIEIRANILTPSVFVRRVGDLDVVAALHLVQMLVLTWVLCLTLGWFTVVGFVWFDDNRLPVELAVPLADGQDGASLVVEGSKSVILVLFVPVLNHIARFDRAEDGQGFFESALGGVSLDFE